MHFHELDPFVLETRLYQLPLPLLASLRNTEPKQSQLSISNFQSVPLFFCCYTQGQTTLPSLVPFVPVIFQTPLPMPPLLSRLYWKRHFLYLLSSILKGKAPYIVSPALSLRGGSLTCPVSASKPLGWLVTCHLSAPESPGWLPHLPLT